MKPFSILLVAVSLFAGVSCERHDFAETRKLHEHHSAGSSHETAGHEAVGHEGTDHEDKKEDHKVEH